MSTPPPSSPRDPQETPAVEHGSTSGSSARSRPRQIIDELTYPHGIHPALVPGVGVEDRKVRFNTDKTVFTVTALLIVGLFTRPVAFVLSGEMAVAYFMFHQPRNLFPTLNGGDAAILYCFVFLYLSAAGGGAWSLDRLMRRDRVPEAMTAPGARLT